MKAKRITTILWISILIPALVACSRPKIIGPTPIPVKEQPTSEPTNTPTQAVYLPAAFLTAGKPDPGFIDQSTIPPAESDLAPIPEDWLSLSSPELGIQFRFPPLPGEISYEYNAWPERDWDPTGTLVQWEVVREDEYGTYAFAASVSEDMLIGRMRWYTDITNWVYDETQSKYLIGLAGPDQPQVEVQPIRVVTRSDGLQGIIFTPETGFFNSRGTCAVLHLPDGFSPKIKVISFYFADQTTLEDIEAVLGSLSYTMP